MEIIVVFRSTFLRNIPMNHGLVFLFIVGRRFLWNAHYFLWMSAEDLQERWLSSHLHTHCQHMDFCSKFGSKTFLSLPPRWEAYNLSRFRHNFHGESSLVFPAVSQPLLAPGLLVESWIEVCASWDLAHRPYLGNCHSCSCRCCILCFCQDCCLRAVCRIFLKGFWFTLRTRGTSRCHSPWKHLNRW